jgi:type VI secretion system protein ImpC
LQVHLVDVSRQELAADLGSDAVEGSGIHRLLVEESVGTPGSDPWALLVGAFALGEDAGELDILARLGRVARDAGAPFIAEASPVLAGVPSIAAAPDPDDWTDDAPSGWSELRALPVAQHVALALPRLLLRLPYGKHTDECDVVSFEEMLPDVRPAHESYLWGSGSLAAALLLGEAFVDSGWSLRPGREISNLPLHVYHTDGETVATPCAEVLLTERAAERLLDRGLSPLLSVRDSDAVILPRLQSIAEPLARLSARWRAPG